MSQWFYYCRFTSDDDGEYGQGFQMQYEMQYCDGADRDDNRTCGSASCGGHFTAESGVLTSPYYPENYPIYTECVYLISTSSPHGTNIAMTILSMDIEHADPDYYGYDDYIDSDYHQFGGLTCWDYLEVRDGASEQSPLINGYCGNSDLLSLPIEIRSSQDTLWIK